MMVLDEFKRASILTRERERGGGEGDKGKERLLFCLRGKKHSAIE